MPFNLYTAKNLKFKKEVQIISYIKSKGMSEEYRDNKGLQVNPYFWQLTDVASV